VRLPSPHTLSPPPELELTHRLDVPQLVGTTISLGVFTRALLAAVPLLATTKDRRLDVLRFGDDGFKSIGKLLLGGFLQGYVWAWCVALPSLLSSPFSLES